MTTSYRKTLYLRDGDDNHFVTSVTSTTGVLLKHTQPTSTTTPAALVPFKLETAGTAEVNAKNIILKTTGSNANTYQVKLTNSGDVAIQDATFPAEYKLGPKLSEMISTTQSVKDTADAAQSVASTANGRTVTHQTNWKHFTRYDEDGGDTNDALDLISDWNLRSISSKFSTVTTNHSTLSTHVTNYLTIPTDEDDAVQTLQTYVESQVTAEKDRINKILLNAPESLDTLNELKIALETTDYSLVDVQINIVNKLNALANVVAYLTSDNPTLEFNTNPPTWYASITEPVRNSVDQPELANQVANEPPTSLSSN
tara:strand:+ start:30 stop:968 length:939 start_codon:yes stop_codon:yes gene_type:complete